MPVKRFIISPPNEMTEESVRETAEMLFEALKGIDAGATVVTSSEPPKTAQDGAKSIDSVEQTNMQDEGKTHGDSERPVE